MIIGCQGLDHVARQVTEEVMPALQGGDTVTIGGGSDEGREAFRVAIAYACINASLTPTFTEAPDFDLQIEVSR